LGEKTLDSENSIHYYWAEDRVAFRTIVGAQMRLFSRYVFAWMLMISLILAGAMADGFAEWGRLLDIVCRGANSLLALISFSLSRRELGAGSKMMFLSFAICFGMNALATPLFQLLTFCMKSTDEWSRFFFYEYNLIGYFVLLSTSVFSLVLSNVFGPRRIWQKNAATLFLVFGATTYFFSPIIEDPLYLVKVPELSNVKAVFGAMKQLSSEGNDSPSIEQVAARADLQHGTDSGERTDISQQSKIAYATEAMKYIRNDDVYVLLYRPLWKSCAKMSLLLIIGLLVFVVHKFMKDSPEGAYIEKIAWCLLPYCSFEALHHHVYATIHSFKLFSSVLLIGGYISITCLLLLCLVFALRLRFIMSIEGGYYERQLLRDAAHVTRWRDSFDNWILRQFMDPGELDRRFLMQRRNRE
jgi:hypothetical protein